jgi:hypothetical protein
MNLLPRNQPPQPPSTLDVFQATHGVRSGAKTATCASSASMIRTVTRRKHRAIVASTTTHRREWHARGRLPRCRCAACVPGRMRGVRLMQAGDVCSVNQPSVLIRFSMQFWVIRILWKVLYSQEIWLTFRSIVWAPMYQFQLKLHGRQWLPQQCCGCRTGAPQWQWSLLYNTI